MKRSPFVVFCAAAPVLLVASHIASAQPPQPHVIHSAGNPILSDGSYYSADPAPIVVGDTLYILAGRDEAQPNVNDFGINEWQLFSTKNRQKTLPQNNSRITRTSCALIPYSPGQSQATPMPDKSFRVQPSASTCTRQCRRGSVNTPTLSLRCVRRLGRPLRPRRFPRPHCKNCPRPALLS